MFLIFITLIYPISVGEKLVLLQKIIMEINTIL